MPATHADLIAALQYELLFVECGGYRSASCRRRAALLLEDGPMCSREEAGGKCLEQFCPWFAFVPLRRQGEETPCRHIIVGAHGETIDLLYRTATPEECEESLHAWLVAAIARLEQQNAADATQTQREGG